MSNTAASPAASSPLDPFSNHSRDVIFAIGILVILAILFLPIPPTLIDIGLAFSIALSVLILMVGLWIQQPLNFSSFPTILLIATMLRLSLNISTTRLILSNGHMGERAAGDIISGFSKFVMGGDFVIGVIVFIILVTVNFVVITKGATRIAEVGARFTLDAIPGKQMAIDADLSAGLLDEKEAQKRRRELEEESSFFGSMDGASKFVRGDAIAGLIITAVNIFGGIIIGVLRHDMSVAEAADVFTRLSVGDGLVSQIPALIVSLAAGLLVSKGGTRGSADQAVISQLAGYPKALVVAAGLLAFLSLTPGLPFFPFILLAAAMAFVAYIIPVRKGQRARAEKAADDARLQEQAERDADSIQTSMEVAALELSVGKQLGLKILVDNQEMGYRISRMRKKFATEYGFVIPEVKVREDLSLPPRSYKISLFGTAVAQHEVSLSEVMIITSKPEQIPYAAESIREPAFGGTAWLVPDIYAAELKLQGFQVIDPMSQVLTHLSETVRNNLDHLFSYKDMRQLIGGLDREYSKLVEEITPSHLSFSGLQAVFKMLLAERVSVRNVTKVLEAVAEIAPYCKRGEQIAEHVRMRLAQQICGTVAQNGQLKILRMGTHWDEAFNKALQRDARGELSEFQMPSEELERFGLNAKKKIKELFDQGHQFAVATTPESRKYVRMIIERLFPSQPVISNLEIAGGIDIEVLGEIGNGAV